MLAAPNARHQQVAYVTNDIARAMKVFEETYGAKGFFAFDNIQSGAAAPGQPHLKIALTRIGGVEFELIEPIGGTAPLFSDVLPKDGRFAIQFHHIAVRIHGSLEDWNQHRALVDKSGHEIVFQGALGDDMRFLYTDERARVGHYLEHVWMSPGLLATMKTTIPAIND